VPIFLNLRVRPAGGEVSDHVSPRLVTIDPATGNANDVALSNFDLAAAVLGKNIILAAHGFNVNQHDGYQSLSNWSTLLQLDATWLFIGLVWPGDSSWLGPVCYPGEGKHAMDCGKLLAPFLIANMSGARSVSFVSHSLGTRFVLQTITELNSLDPQFAVAQIALMAGAVNHDCLTGEYALAAKSVGKINLLASIEDEVLSAAFPIGNVFEGIIDSDHPWFQSALGQKGPLAIPPGKAPGRWQVPKAWNFGHGSYLKLISRSVPSVTLPQDIPDDGKELPLPYEPLHESSWSAAFVSSRFK
jgi:hypothetical protein